VQLVGSKPTLETRSVCARNTLKLYCIERGAYLHVTHYSRNPGGSALLVQCGRVYTERSLHHGSCHHALNWYATLAPLYTRKYSIAYSTRIGLHSIPSGHNVCLHRCVSRIRRIALCNHTLEECAHTAIRVIPTDTQDDRPSVL
jgi:hypothetical protein